MPRPRPPHLHRERSAWVVRIGHGPRRRITAPWGTAEFRRQYVAAVDELTIHEPRKTKQYTLQWLWVEYRKSLAWQSLSPATKRQRENIMRAVLVENANVPFDQITRKHIVAGRDRRAATPHAARHFVATLRRLFEWAVEAELASINPAETVKMPSVKTDGHHTWTVGEIAKFRAHWPLGTRERLAFEVLLNTGLRRGDACTLGPAMMANGEFHIETEKTGTSAVIPIMPALAEAIEAGPCGATTYIATESGKPRVKESFGNWFREACTTAGVPGTAHGLRKALATMLAEGGASVNELESVFGWQGGNMASLYTRKANRAVMSRAAMAKLSASLFPQAGNSVAKTGKE